MNAAARCSWRRPCHGVLLLALALALVACGDPGAGGGPTAGMPGPETGAAERWYSEQQVALGAEVFSQNCALCHGPDAEGTVADWRQRQEDGSFPPPPLNGSAHAWHHPNSILLQVINRGGAEFGGKMPAFAEVLNQEEKLAAIAYFQNFWSDEIYAQWQQMGGSN